MRCLREYRISLCQCAGTACACQFKDHVALGIVAFVGVCFGWRITQNIIFSGRFAVLDTGVAVIAVLLARTQREFRRILRNRYSEIFCTAFLAGIVHHIAFTGL